MRLESSKRDQICNFEDQIFCLHEQIKAAQTSLERERMRSEKDLEDKEDQNEQLMENLKQLELEKQQAEESSMEAKQHSENFEREAIEQ